MNFPNLEHFYEWFKKFKRKQMWRQATYIYRGRLHKAENKALFTVDGIDDREHITVDVTDNKLKKLATREEVLKNLKELIGKTYDDNDIICSYEDYDGCMEGNDIYYTVDEYHSDEYGNCICYTYYTEYGEEAWQMYGEDEWQCFNIVVDENNIIVQIY